MKVWKLASRWSYDGNVDSSVLNLFRSNKTVFVYNLKPNETKSFRIESKVQVGDLLAISDGLKIVSIAKVLQKPAPIKEKWTETVRKIDFNNENILGMAVEFVELDENQQFAYKKMGRFHQLHHNVKDRIIQLWNNAFDPKLENKRFYISARSSSLFKQGNIDSILDNKTTYTIPIYQRPYSWGENHLRRFISDLYNSFVSSDGNELLMEPIFMGTIQLTKAKFEDKNLKDFDIIDGQQRLSTIMIILKILKQKYPDNFTEINLNWLKTHVASQQEYLDEFLNKTSFVDENSYNPYLRNAFLISNLIEEIFLEEEIEMNGFDIVNFKQHLLENVYFVVLETNAGLSKNLQIFDAINTTGLDLNGGDIFKIRMYEYLRVKGNYNEKAFEEISKLYEKIEYERKIVQIGHIGITYILSIYKTFLIGKYNLPRALHAMGTDTFYERLFDTLLNINKWEHFSDKALDVKLSLEEIDSFINIRFAWEKKWQSKEKVSFEDMVALNLIWQSRYGNAWNLLFLMHFCFGETDHPKINEIMQALSKLLTLYSVIYKKRVNEIHNGFILDLITNIVNSNNSESVLQDIKGKIQEKDDSSIDRYLTDNLIDNAKRKRIICSLSAALEEKVHCTDITKLKEIEIKVFHNEPHRKDIEHITAINRVNVMTDENEKSEWQRLINSLGNLVLLESSINKSIKDKPTEDKKSKYGESKLQIVKLLTEHLWTPEACNERNQKELNKLKDFLFS
jgi:hypothetical protein